MSKRLGKLQSVLGVFRTAVPIMIPLGKYIYSSLLSTSFSQWHVWIIPSLYVIFCVCFLSLRLRLLVHQLPVWAQLQLKVHFNLNTCNSVHWLQLKTEIYPHSISHPPSCLSGLNFYQVFLPHTEGATHRFIRAEAHEVYITAGAPSKGCATASGQQTFLSRVQPLRAIENYNTHLSVFLQKRAAYYLPEMTNLLYRLMWPAGVWRISGKKRRSLV